MQIRKKKTSVEGSNFRSDLPAGESKSTTTLPNLPIGRLLHVQSLFILRTFCDRWPSSALRRSKWLEVKRRCSPAPCGWLTLRSHHTCCLFAQQLMVWGWSGQFDPLAPGERTDHTMWKENCWKFSCWSSQHAKVTFPTFFPFLWKLYYIWFIHKVAKNYFTLVVAKKNLLNPHLSSLNPACFSFFLPC